LQFGILHRQKYMNMPLAHCCVTFRKVTVFLDSTDKMLLIFWLLLSVTSLLMHDRIELWRAMIVADVMIGVLTVGLAFAACRLPDMKIFRWAHDWAAFPYVLFTYKQIYYMIGPIHQGKDYDFLLMSIDRMLFGVNPTEWLARFTNPILTEVLQIAYSLFYVLFIAVGIELYRKQDLSKFRRFCFTIVYGFIISYIGYFFLPAVGPRFTIYDFSSIDNQMPGLFFTQFLRKFVNFFESINPAMSNSIALAKAQRDVFPSGHTMMTLLVIVLAYNYRLRIRYGIYVAGTLLIVATVYLRYHYVIDIIAGALLAVFCLYTAKRVCTILESFPRTSISNNRETF
jgi:membrane-associated phospholipid phosphatase